MDVSASPVNAFLTRFILKTIITVALSAIFLLIVCQCEHCSAAQMSSVEANLREIPVLYKGRFRPMEAYARLWLYDLYHRESIKADHRKSFGISDGSALALIWKMQFQGYQPFIQAPLFWVHLADLKRILGLDLSKDRFSYQELHRAIYTDKETSGALLRKLIPYYYYKSYVDPSNRSKSNKLELSQLAAGLWITSQDSTLAVLSVPNIPPWNILKPSESILNIDDSIFAYISRDRTLVDEAQSLIFSLNQFSLLGGNYIPSEDAFLQSYHSLINARAAPSEIAFQLDLKHPLQTRLIQAGTLLKLLPGKFKLGEWYSLQAMHVKVFNPATQRLELAGNFTVYPDNLFAEIRKLYFELEQAAENHNEVEADALAIELAGKLKFGYTLIAGSPYTESAGKLLRYPSVRQLQAEVVYMRFPLIEICIALYFMAALALLITSAFNKAPLYALSMTLFLSAFTLHTAILVLRCYIMGRPPVSNMFETVIYVPWIAALISLVLQLRYKNAYLLLASGLVSLVLLVLLQISHLNTNLENVQAVLDSQYWLIIHVLMVVGSYGVFLLCGVLGHFYLGGVAWRRCETPQLQLLAKVMLNSMYLGLLLLIPGTVLGGVWAAESWGRFWDWDPKESWAFISICVYLIWVHAYRFHRISNIGLAFGAVTGLLAISFTWYGVNYILGTGFHSYGFGSGGEVYYYGYIAAELLFLCVVAGLLWNKQLKKTPL